MWKYINLKVDGDNMKWFDGREIELKHFSGEEICEKLSLEMWDYDYEQWEKCDECIRNSLYIIDFDTVANMEGFPTPHYGYFSNEYYLKIVKAFRDIGDNNDADILAEAFYIDSYYQQIFDNTEDKNEFDKIYDEFSERIDALEKNLYLNTDFDVWSLLYKYLDAQIKKG